MADDNKIIHYIPPMTPKREKRLGIYCRVSTNSADQLKSLTDQVSALTRLTAVNPKWLLVDVYIGIASSKTGSSRKEFTRMLQDCKSREKVTVNKILQYSYICFCCCSYQKR